MMKRLLITLPIALAVFACAQDPFEGKSFVTVKPEPSIAPQVEPPKPQENYILDFNPVMNFVENEEGTFTLSAKVPPPGKAILHIADLPKGAIFSEADQKLTWKPGYEAANDPKNPNIVAKSYEIRIQLASSNTPQSVWERKAILVVNDTARKFEVTTSPTVYLEEQKEHVQQITINCEDFPTGPFVVTPENLPVGATLKSLGGNKYEVRHTAPLTEVNVNNAPATNPLTKTMDVLFHVKSPRGNVSAASKWNIRDLRQRPSLIMPENLKQGLDISFTVTSVDGNSEVQPKLLLQYKPNFGSITTETDVNAVPNTSTLRVRWEKIPPAKLGTSETLTFQACNYNAYKSLTNCESKNIKVSFVAEVHLAPKIDRSYWPSGQNKEFKLNSNQSIALPIRDGEDGSLNVKVEVLPKDLQTEITWYNGQLKVTPKTAGEKNALIVATSVHNMVAAEAFQYTVPMPSPTPSPSPSPSPSPVAYSFDSEEGDLQ